MNISKINPGSAALSLHKLAAIKTKMAYKAYKLLKIKSQFEDAEKTDLHNKYPTAKKRAP